MNVWEGVLLVDKPVGCSSFDVVRKIRQLTGQKRVGHAGTLDPLASGLMVLCLGRYTKLAGLFVDSDKIYDVTVHLGISTTTDDVEGEVVSQKDCSHLLLHDIVGALEKFIGPLMQTPPRFSAVKIKGRRAYSLARASQSFDLEKRPVAIFSISQIYYEHPLVSFRLHCSKGTYVRSLARDLGEALGVNAHATNIRRVQSGAFSVEGAVSLDQLSLIELSRSLRRGARVLANFATIAISDREKDNFRVGKNPIKTMSLSSSVAVALNNDEPVAILRNHNGFAAISRII